MADDESTARPRRDVAIVFAVSGFLLGAGAFFYAFRQSARLAAAEADREHIEQLVEEKTALTRDVQEANKRISALRGDIEGLRQQAASADARLNGHEKRLDGLEKPK